MKSKVVLPALVAALSVSSAFADCSFTFVNKSTHPVTIQGFFLEGGDATADSAWITVGPTRQITQVRSGKKCNAIYKHTGQVATRVNLKNNSGYLIGNKGFFFAADRSYSHYTGDRALADDGKPVTLSNGQKITSKEFKVFICEGSVDGDQCN
jgi:hypothetical protein